MCQTNKRELTKKIKAIADSQKALDKLEAIAQKHLAKYAGQQVVNKGSMIPEFLQSIEDMRHEVERINGMFVRVNYSRGTTQRNGLVVVSLGNNVHLLREGHVWLDAGEIQFGMFSMVMRTSTNRTPFDVADIVDAIIKYRKAKAEAETLRQKLVNLNLPFYF